MLSSYSSPLFSWSILPHFWCKCVSYIIRWNLKSWYLILGPEDITALDIALTFDPENIRQEVRIVITNDVIVEPDQDFTSQLQLATSQDGVVIRPDLTTVDDDSEFFLIRNQRLSLRDCQVLISNSYGILGNYSCKCFSMGYRTQNFLQPLCFHYITSKALFLPDQVTVKSSL